MQFYNLPIFHCTYRKTVPCLLLDLIEPIALPPYWALSVPPDSTLSLKNMKDYKDHNSLSNLINQNDQNHEKEDKIMNVHETKEDKFYSFV